MNENFCLSWEIVIIIYRLKRGGGEGEGEGRGILGDLMVSSENGGGFGVRQQSIKGDYKNRSLITC